MAHTLRLSMAFAAMLVSAQADAATLTLIANNYFVGAPGAEVSVPQAPDDPNSAIFDSFTGTVNYVVVPPDGSFIPGTWRSPWQYTQSSPPGTLYEPIGDFTSMQAGSVGTTAYASAKNTLRLAWGSPDTYNTIEFWLGGVHLLGYDVTGADLTPPDTALATAVGVNFVSLFVIPTFDKIVFKTAINAFEFANLRALGRGDGIPNIPLPAGLILLLSGLAGLGFLGRARAKAV